MGSTRDVRFPIHLTRTGCTVSDISSVEVSRCERRFRAPAVTGALRRRLRLTRKVCDFLLVFYTLTLSLELYKLTGWSKKRTPWLILTITSVNMDRF